MKLTPTLVEEFVASSWRTDMENDSYIDTAALYSRLRAALDEPYIISTTALQVFRMDIAEQTIDAARDRGYGPTVVEAIHHVLSIGAYDGREGATPLERECGLPDYLVV